MKITVKRVDYYEDCTIGKMYVDGVYECYTLEDKVRDNGVKVAGDTAIPIGTYNVIVTFSNRFQRLLPLLENVPNFVGVRIHTGNTSLQTEGCLLVGRTRASTNSIGESKLAFASLFPKLQAAKARGESISITVS